MQMGEASKEKCSKPDLLTKLSSSDRLLDLDSLSLRENLEAQCAMRWHHRRHFACTVPKVERQSVRFKMD
jgi:hypothetical protein